MTYAVVNAPFLLLAALLIAAAWVVVRRRQRQRQRSRGRSGAAQRMGVGVLVALAGVVVLTAVFDNVIILTGVVDYDHSLTSGIRIGVAPVEDFAYALVAGIALPALWHLVPARPRREPEEGDA